MSEQCSEQVYTDRWGEHQCSRVGTVFEEGKRYCKQHSKAGKAARRAAQQERWEQDGRSRAQAWARDQEERRRAECFPGLLEALKRAEAALECAGIYAAAAQARAAIDEAEEKKA